MYQVDDKGFFGKFGGAYVPEILYKCVTELQQAYKPIIESEEFKKEYHQLLRDYVGRPSPLYYAKRMSEKYGCQLYLKREDLNHTGAHKINNTIGQILMAKKMGKKEIADEFYKRAQNYRNVYNPATSFMQPRDEKGNFAANFSPDDYTEDICESNGWQYFWSVPQDLDGLVGLVGSKERFAEKLDSMFTYVPKSTEDLPIFSTGMIGQYAHGNEPSHHIPFLYAWTSQPWKTQYWQREIMNKMYRNNIDGLCGNDDCGQMSAWYILSSMGFYPVCPGTDEYVLGAPLFKKAVLHFENGNSLTIDAGNNSAQNVYIQSLQVDGNEYTKNYLRHGDLLKGGTLKFEMGDKPNLQRGVRAEDYPYSFSKEKRR